MLKHIKPLMKHIVIIIFFVLTNFLGASVFIGSEDEFKIKKLELLSSNENFNIHTTSYPLNRSSLNNPENFGLITIGQLIEYKKALNKYFEKGKKFNSQIVLRNFSDDSMIKNIDDNWFFQNSVSLSNSYTDKNFSINLNISAVDDSYNEKKFLLNGTNISFSKWNMIFGVGFIDRWWGPSHHNNLILSNYGNPPPGVYLESLEGFSFKNRVLSNLGKINLSIFINRLEKNRHVPNPFLNGTRVTFNPIKNLHLGLSRTIMMGGDGKREDFKAFRRAFFEPGSGENPEIKSGIKGDNISNQLAGYDVKYDISLEKGLLSIYFQQIAEDADTGDTSPLSAYMNSFGSEFKFNINGLLNSIIIEFTKTITEDHFRNGRNVAYEHGVYQSGYRYRGIPIGAFIDTDSKYIQISYLKEVNDSDRINFDLFYAEPNKDNDGRNVWGSAGEPFFGLKTKYKFKLTKNLSTSFVLTLSDKKLLYLDKSLSKNILGFIAEYNF